MIALSYLVTLWVCLTVAAGCVVLLLVSASRSRPDEHVSPFAVEYVEAMQRLSAEHRSRTGHSFGEGTAQPETCPVCAFLGGAREPVDP